MLTKCFMMGASDEVVKNGRKEALELLQSLYEDVVYLEENFSETSLFSFYVKGVERFFETESERTESLICKNVHEGTVWAQRLFFIYSSKLLKIKKEVKLICDILQNRNSTLSELANAREKVLIEVYNVLDFLSNDFSIELFIRFFFVLQRAEDFLKNEKKERNKNFWVDWGKERREETEKKIKQSKLLLEQIKEKNNLVKKKIKKLRECKLEEEQKTKKKTDTNNNSALFQNQLFSCVKQENNETTNNNELLETTETNKTSTSFFFDEDDFYTADEDNFDTASENNSITKTIYKQKFEEGKSQNITDREQIIGTVELITDENITKDTFFPKLESVPNLLINISNETVNENSSIGFFSFCSEENISKNAKTQTEQIIKSEKFEDESVVDLSLKLVPASHFNVWTETVDKTSFKKKTKFLSFSEKNVSQKKRIRFLAWSEEDLSNRNWEDKIEDHKNRIVLSPKKPSLNKTNENLLSQTTNEQTTAEANEATSIDELTETFDKLKISKKIKKEEKDDNKSTIETIEFDETKTDEILEWTQVASNWSFSDKENTDEDDTTWITDEQITKEEEEKKRIITDNKKKIDENESAVKFYLSPSSSSSSSSSSPLHYHDSITVTGVINNDDTPKKLEENETKVKVVWLCPNKKEEYKIQQDAIIQTTDKNASLLRLNREDIKKNRTESVLNVVAKKKTHKNETVKTIEIDELRTNEANCEQNHISDKENAKIKNKTKATEENREEREEEQFYDDDSSQPFFKEKVKQNITKSQTNKIEEEDFFNSGGDGLTKIIETKGDSNKETERKEQTNVGYLIFFVVLLIFLAVFLLYSFNEPKKKGR